VTDIITVHCPGSYWTHQDVKINLRREIASPDGHRLVADDSLDPDSRYTLISIWMLGMVFPAIPSTRRVLKNAVNGNVLLNLGQADYERRIASELSRDWKPGIEGTTRASVEPVDLNQIVPS